MASHRAPAAPRRWWRPRRRVAVALVAAAAVVAVLGVVRATSGGPDVVVTASAESEGRLQDLASAGDRASGQPRQARSAAWTTPGGGVGQWVSLRYSEPTSVDRVRLLSAPGGGTLRSALLVFDGGASLLASASADDDGDVEVRFPRRDVREVRITLAGVDAGEGGSTAVALAAADVDDGGRGALPQASLDGASVTASSASGQAGAALADGDVAAGRAGLEWVADAGDEQPWVQYAWPSPREVSSAQVLGPAEPAVDPDYAAAAALGGVLEFDDGSRVVVSGIEAAGAQGTTVAFAPRVVSSVRLVLTKTIPQAQVALRELRLYGPGTTPPRWPAPDQGYASQAEPAQACTTPSEDPYAQTARTSDAVPLALLCPSVGSAVQGRAAVAVAAAPGTEVSASAPLVVDGEAGQVRPVATGTADASGRALLEVDLGALQSGPVTLQVERSTAGSELPLYVQLLNGSGQPLQPGPDGGSTAPAGMTLQWDEEFTDPLSVSADGKGATYAAVKPEYWGGSQFGDAVFADPADGAGTLSVVDREYLRIRAEPIAGRDVDAPYGQQHLSGILSSARSGAGGFAVQYGYFEARMVGGPGTGTWPAFWALNTQAATKDNQTAGEADAVELYGHNPVGSCHTLHDWGNAQAPQSTGAQCLDDNGLAPWPVAWHTYGMRVVPGGAVFTIDGQQVAAGQGLGRSDEPFYFLLDLALGGGWPVDLSATSGTSDLYVDWVRAYS